MSCENKLTPKNKAILFAMILGSAAVGVVAGNKMSINHAVKEGATKNVPVVMTEVDLGELDAGQDVSALSIPKDTTLSGTFDDKGVLHLEMKVKFNRDGKAQHETWAVTPATKQLLVTVPATSMLKTAVPVKPEPASAPEVVNAKTKK